MSFPEPAPRTRSPDATNKPMWNIEGSHSRLCDGLTRRDVLRFGGVGAFGLSLPHLLRSQARAAEVSSVRPTASGPGVHAKNCIVLFLMGGPPQHSTWDPKPEAPAEVRGEFGPISTVGARACRSANCSRMTARLAQHLCLLRAVSSGDNAHSSSGYYMLTGPAAYADEFRERQSGVSERFSQHGGRRSQNESRRGA